AAVPLLAGPERRLDTLALGDVGRDAADLTGPSLLVAEEHPAVMDPADGPAGLEDAELDVVVVDVFARNPAGEPLGHPRAILGMNGVSPQPGLTVERLSGKPPEALEARAHVEDPL